MALARARRLNARADSDLPAAHVAFGDGPLHWLDRGRAATAERFERVLSPERAALCKALTIGDFGGVDDEVRERWSDAGMAHLLSISGLHVGLLAWLVYSGCLWLLRRVPLVTTRYSAQRAAAWVSLPPLILFCLWSGAAVAAVRATVMVAVYLFGRALARPSVATNALGVAGAGILLWDPHSLWDPSFLLSFAAVTALMLLPPQKPARHWYGRVARVLVLALLASVVSTLATAPIMAYAFGRISLVAPLPNLLAVPLCNLVAVPLTILFALLSPLSAGVEQVLGALLSLVIGALDAIALYAAAVPFAAVDLPRPAWHEITAWAVFCTALLLCVRQRPARYVALAAAVVLAAQVGVRMLAARGDGVLHIAHVDVGQGDAAIVRFPAGSVMLFDAGGALFEGGFDPGRRVLAPLLRAQGIRTLDLVVVSHPDPDHLQGLLYVAEHFAIRELWTSGFGYDPRSPDDPSATPRDYQALQRLYQSVKAQGGVVRYVADMPAESERDGVALRLLHPRPSPDEAEGLTYYPGLSDNDNSVVLHLTYGDCTALFPGDIEADVEAKLAPILPHADVFKSPHHGSRTSSSQALLDAVDATAVVISLGEHNRFGFPKPETLARYAAAKLTVWRTDLLGQITLSTDGSAWQLQAEREGVTHTIACRRR
jgi:competence protein ComEC